MFSLNIHAQIQSNSVESAQAIYLYNFTKYIDWSVSNLSNSDFVISVIGTYNEYNEIKKYMSEKKVINRPIKVVQVKDLNEMTRSEIVFLPGNKYKLISQIREKFSDANILFVTDNYMALKNGSCINFWMNEDKLAFELNKTNIEKQKLRLSVSLLNTAKTQTL